MPCGSRAEKARWESRGFLPVGAIKARFGVGNGGAAGAARLAPVSAFPSGSRPGADSHPHTHTHSAGPGRALLWAAAPPSNPRSFFSFFGVFRPKALTPARAPPVP